MSTDPPVVIAGGGTGGHLYPGLAVAEALAARGRWVEFVGTSSGIEVRAVPAAGFTLHVLPGRQLRGGGVGRAILGTGALARGVGRALAVLAEIRPGLVVGVGGYASVATVLAARMRRIPTLLLEQNVVPGAANRLLGRLAGSRVCVGFAETLAAFAPGRAVHTGNPVRTRVIETPRMRRDRLGLLVVGGSGGAHHLNTAMVEAAGRLGETVRAIDVVHQTGSADAASARDGYAALGLPVRVEPFIDDMGAAYAAADVVIARAGAMTCAELTALGLPSVLVPYPFAADDHQRANAEVLVRAGAAEMILDRELDGTRLAETVARLVRDDGARTKMAANARALGRPEAAMRVATECQRLLDGGVSVSSVAPS